MLILIRLFLKLSSFPPAFFFKPSKFWPISFIIMLSKVIILMYCIEMYCKKSVLRWYLVQENCNFEIVRFQHIAFHSYRKLFYFILVPILFFIFSFFGTYSSVSIFSFVWFTVSERPFYVYFPNQCGTVLFLLVLLAPLITFHAWIVIWPHIAGFGIALLFSTKPKFQGILSLDLMMSVLFWFMP